jgi:hypothetical protein
MHEKILKALCPNISSEDLFIEEASLEFTFVFRLITLNLPSFEVELTMLNFFNDEQGVRYQ